jgi:hypothetical protein
LFTFVLLLLFLEALDDEEKDEDEGTCTTECTTTKISSHVS